MSEFIPGFMQSGRICELPFFVIFADFLNMFKKPLIIIALIWGLLPVQAQNFSSSRLPVILITTDINPATGKAYVIVDEPKVPATMKIIYRPDGTRNYLTDRNTAAYLNYNGKITIEIRGSSSQDLPKKPYGFTTVTATGSNNNVSLLGMPKENDWVLNGLAFDPALMRDYLAYELYRKTGNYSPRGQYCEVMINGEYRGLYILLEKIKVDDNRVNITRISTTDNAGELVTGGYITKSDKTTGGDPVAWYTGNAAFIHHYPKPEEVTSQQNAYIRKVFTDLNTAATNKNNSITNGIPSFIDIPSFVDFMLMNELFSNPDGYQFSTYFHKERNGKLRAGPIWDFNLTLGNDLFQWGFDRSKNDLHQFENFNVGAPFWKNMYYNATFKCYLAKRWAELTAAGQALNYTEIVKLIDQTAALIAETVPREQAKWNTVSTHTANIANIKTWLQARITWMTQQYGSYTACTNVAVPKLVISKINYNPQTTGFIVADSLEFVEITNTGTQTATLTGVYFRELGMTYQFPAHSSLQAGKRLFLASSARLFELHYGFKPFGQYTRKLGNDAENLVLSDAWGNEITRVEYSDKSPWPTDADGKGSYLEIIDLYAGNNDPLNWRASGDKPTLLAATAADIINIYPIPARTHITVSAGLLTVNSYSIADLTGRVLMQGLMPYDQTIQLHHLKPDVYLIRLSLESGEEVLKKLVVR